MRHKDKVGEAGSTAAEALKESNATVITADTVRVCVVRMIFRIVVYMWV